MKNQNELYACVIVRTEKSHTCYIVGPFQSKEETIKWCDSFRIIAEDKHDDMSAFPRSIIEPTGKSNERTVSGALQMIEDIWHELHPSW